MLKKIACCRICGSTAFEEVIDLGEQTIASNFRVSGAPEVSLRPIPLRLVRCVDDRRGKPNCGLVQLDHTVPGWAMYTSYGYQSGINDTMKNHLAGITEAAVALFDYKELEGSTILDIGANDGTLLASYPDLPDCRFFAFEPSNIVTKAPGKDLTVVKEFFDGLAMSRIDSSTKFKIITSIAMFYDLDDPNGFVQNIGMALHSDGIWISEFSYMPEMLRNKSYDTICHEHLEYYHLAPLEYLLHKHGLEIFKIEFNEANGGSIRFYACHIGKSGRFQSDEDLLILYNTRLSELDGKYDTDFPYEAFREQVKAVRSDLIDMLARLKSEGKKIGGYGASTKGNVILQYCELDASTICSIADRNPWKVGGQTTGSEIPIISEEEMREGKFDYLLALPWHFKEEFLRRESEFIEGGGRFIFPLPEVSILPLE